MTQVKVYSNRRMQNQITAISTPHNASNSPPFQPLDAIALPPFPFIIGVQADTSAGAAHMQVLCDLGAWGLVGVGTWGCAVPAHAACREVWQ